MNRYDVLEEMKDSIGTQDPIKFFKKFTDIFNLLFDRIDNLEEHLKQVRAQTALAIKWEPALAADMLVRKIALFRQDKDAYACELSKFKAAYAEDIVTQNYVDFVKFWTETLGFHPFMDYK